MTDRRFFLVTPVLNGARFLSETLACIDAQGCADWIHCVVDGGSTDGTVELVQRSMAQEPRRRLIQGKDRSLYDAVFKGFDALADHIRDDDICFWLNADDLLAPWALATMRRAFDLYHADWVTGQPGQWDADGRLVLVRPSGWYPQRCIRNGWFNSYCLGWLQQESMFFTARLLRRLPPDKVAVIRSAKMAGDFLLWRSFAKFAPLHAAPTFVGGFRMHGANLSMEGADLYMQEALEHGAFLPPPGIRQALRFLYRIVTSWRAGKKAQYPLLPPGQY